MFWLSNKKSMFRYVHRLDTVKSGWFIVHFYIHIYLKFSQNIVCHSLNIDFVLAISEDPDEMPLYAAFHLGRHRLPKYPFWGFWSSKV